MGRGNRPATSDRRRADFVRSGGTRNRPGDLRPRWSVRPPGCWTRRSEIRSDVGARCCPLPAVPAVRDRSSGDNPRVLHWRTPPPIRLGQWRSPQGNRPGTQSRCCLITSSGHRSGPARCAPAVPGETGPAGHLRPKMRTTHEAVEDPVPPGQILPSNPRLQKKRAGPKTGPR